MLRRALLGSRAFDCPVFYQISTIFFTTFWCIAVRFFGPAVRIRLCHCNLKARLQIHSEAGWLSGRWGSPKGCSCSGSWLMPLNFEAHSETP
ncbi:hypothetical protein CEXT_308861 [Caerostris extrusa]|uniref:Secreted protein n=1 Tax=Caerostris extrusa TaxID=172846 RepID=A0AAV4TX63_CAEEX|nr:hypothetical protein CEXT_308861 [Caerostris extrusa]